MRRGDLWAGQFTALGSPCEVLIATNDERLAARLVSLAAGEAWRIEKKFSRYIEGGVVSRINAAAGASVEVDEETAKLLDFAHQCHALSDGRFDVTTGVLRRAWNFAVGAAPPSAEAVRALLPLVGWGKVHWRRPEVRLGPGMEVDLGGIGKEYAVDRAVLLIEREAPNAALVNFGGDIAVAGRREPPWTVGIESSTTAVKLRDGAIATSGDTHRGITQDGRRFGHILNPLTGWPVEDAPRSVSVAAATCSEAGFLSTLAVLRGPDAGPFLSEEKVLHWIL